MADPTDARSPPLSVAFKDCGLCSLLPDSSPSPELLASELLEALILPLVLRSLANGPRAD
jgi:hypothetical protein